MNLEAVYGRQENIESSVIKIVYSEYRITCSPHGAYTLYNVFIVNAGRSIE